MKNKEVIERILNYHPKFPEEYDGCDNYKCGNPEDECKGIVVALTPNIQVIRKAIELKANLIIVHEPTFYSSLDGDWNQDFKNSVYEEKKKLLDDNGITIWRDHDHMHAHNPDGIFTGVLKYMGFESNFKIDYETGGFPHYIIDIGEMSLKDLCKYYIEKIGMNGVRYIGDPDMKVHKIGLVGHLYPTDINNEYSTKVIKTLEEEVDVIIPGEVIDWTVLSYVKDAYELGKNKAVINIGHFNSEELGMKYAKVWLDELLENKIDVTYVPSGDMYNFIKKGE